jgi:DNA helicase HerA-like ATPase
MGKSNLMQVLAGAVMSRQGRYGLLIVDPHGEYRKALASHPWAVEGLRTYANRALPGVSSLRLSLGELSVDDLRTAYDWSRPQEEALFELERHYRGEGLSFLADFARVEDLTGFRDVELSGRVALNTLQVTHRRARRIVGLRCIATDPRVSVGEAVLADLRQGRVVLVDVSGMGSTEEVLVASFLTRRVLDEWSRSYLEDEEAHQQLPVVGVVLEEAQRVLSASQDRESNVFPRLAREGRKFKVGLCAISQQPKLLDDELLSQFNTFFVLGLADEKDRNILRSSSKQDLSALGPEIQTLMPGECLLANLSAPFAVPAKVDLFDSHRRSVPPPPAARPAAVPNVAALVD